MTENDVAAGLDVAEHLSPRQYAAALLEEIREPDGSVGLVPGTGPAYEALALGLHRIEKRLAEIEDRVEALVQMSDED